MAKNLKYQLQRKLELMYNSSCGRSKHQDKQNKDTGQRIYTSTTYEGYAQTAREFAIWVKEAFNVKNLDQVEKWHTEEYLKKRDKDCSAYTVKKDMAALNKMFDYQLKAKDLGLKERAFSNITRSRSQKTYTKAQYDNNRDQIEITKAFGLRRQSFVKEAPTQPFVLCKDHFYIKDGRLWVATIEKGARFRYIECLDKQKQLILGIVPGVVEREYHLTREEALKLVLEPLFDRYDKNIDNHHLRAQFANDKYNELLKKGFTIDKAKDLLTKNLGHNRISVLKHYLYNQAQ